jgi:hypothetical protein
MTTLSPDELLGVIVAGATILMLIALVLISEHTEPR